jgi:hypothetical protein
LVMDEDDPKELVEVFPEILINEQLLKLEQ